MIALNEETVDFIKNLGNPVLTAKIVNLNKYLKENPENFSLERVVFQWITEDEIKLLEEFQKTNLCNKIKLELNSLTEVRSIILDDNFGKFNEDPNRMVTLEDFKYRGYFQTEPPATAPGT